MPAEPNWAAIGALIVSTFAFLRTMASDRRQSRNSVTAQSAARFEADFGHPIRDELRAYERALRTLRVFRLAAGKAPKERVAELDQLRKDWEEAASSVEALLREAEASPAVEADYWAHIFIEEVDKGDRILEELIGNEAPAEADVRDFAARAYEQYESAIAQVRSGLETERSRFTEIEAHTPLSWLKETFLWWRS